MATTSGTNDTAATSQSWGAFVKQIATAGDISSMTAPPWILSPVSLTEYSAFWVSQPSLFTAVGKEKNPERRMVLVLKWFISTLKQQYSSRNEKLGTEKKPLNPILFELFLGEWKGEDENSNLRLISEQVSHHPPVTAYFIASQDDSVQLTGYNGQKATISKTLTICVKQVGHAILKIPAFGETYAITLPSLHIEGLMSGTPYVELENSSYIISSSGYTARLNYTGKGWVSGKKNSYVATIYPTSKSKNVLYTSEGQWTGPFSILDKDKKVVDSFDPSTKEAPLPIVKDISQQEPFESRRVWAKVAEAIKKGDMEVVGREKSIIENQQRELRKKEKESGKDWPRKYFARLDGDDPVFAGLAKLIGESSEPEKTGGVWVWNGTDTKQK